MRNPIPTFITKRTGILLLAARYGVGATLVLSALDKLRRPFDFLADVYGYELVGPSLGVAVAMALPWIELVVGLCLIVGVATGGALLGAAVLGLAFSLVQASAMARGLNIACGCGGLGGGEAIGAASLTRALGLLLVAALAYVGWLCERTPDRPDAE